MDSYTITIAPNDDSGNATTLIVDTTGDQVRITDVHLHAAGGLTGGQMPTVDFRLLLQAVGTPASSPAPIEAASNDAPAQVEAATPVPEVAGEPDLADAAPAAPVRTRRTPRPRTAERAAKRAAKAPAAAAPEAQPATRPRARRAAAKAAAKAAPADTKRAAAPASTTRKPASTTRKKAAAPAETGGRAYRRMPEDFAGVYRQASTAAAVADHYAVPRHTAQGWIRRQKAIDAAAGN